MAPRAESDEKKPRERELKFPDVEHDRLRDRLIEMEAERAVPSSLEENFLFDRDGELEKADSLLRLRVEPRGSWLTFKGPASFEGRTKVRVEHEIEVDDPAVAQKLVEALGYGIVTRYEKKREVWQLGGVSVALDHTPIGDFAELEGDAAEALAKRLGLDPEEAERRNYLRLYEEHRREHPDAPRHMTFDSDD